MAKRLVVKEASEYALTLPISSGYLVNKDNASILEGDSPQSQNFKSQIPELIIGLFFIDMLIIFVVLGGLGDIQDHFQLWLNKGITQAEITGLSKQSIKNEVSYQYMVNDTLYIDTEVIDSALYDYYLNQYNAGNKVIQIEYATNDLNASQPIDDDDTISLLKSFGAIVFGIICFGWFIQFFVKLGRLCEKGQIIKGRLIKIELHRLSERRDLRKEYGLKLDVRFKIPNTNKIIKGRRFYSLGSDIPNSIPHPERGISVLILYLNENNWHIL